MEIHVLSLIAKNHEVHRSIVFAVIINVMDDNAIWQSTTERASGNDPMKNRCLPFAWIP